MHLFAALILKPTPDMFVEHMNVIANQRLALYKFWTSLLLISGGNLLLTFCMWNLFDFAELLIHFLVEKTTTYCNQYIWLPCMLSKSSLQPTNQLFQNDNHLTESTTICKLDEKSYT